MKIGGKNITKKAILLHSIFWIAWIAVFTLIQSLGMGHNALRTWLMYYLITLPVFMVHTYLISYWLLPVFFFRNRFLLFGTWVFFLLVIFSAIELIVSNEIVFRFFSPDMIFNPGYLNLKNVLVSGVGNHYIILIFLAIKAGKSWYRAKNEADNLIREHIETELELFRYRYQPGIVSELIEELEMAAESEPEKVPELIIRISGFMNYLLLNENPDLVPVATELRMADQYLQVQKVILGDRLKTDLSVSGNLNAWLVPPLSIAPFLKNIGRNASENKNDFEVSIVIKAEKKYLLVSITIWSEGEFGYVNDNFSGILRKRLDYHFNGKHRFIENTETNFREIAIEIYHEKM